MDQDQIKTSDKGEGLALIDHADARELTDLSSITAMAARQGDVSIKSRIREIIFGSQDGLLTTLGLVTGVGGATTDNYNVLVAGIAEALAGMIAMAVGEYISAKSQREVYLAEIEKERLEVRTHPQEEMDEVRLLFEREGVAPDDAHTIALLLSKYEHSWLKTMVEKELSFAYEDSGNPFIGAVYMGGAFAFGAIVPIMPYFFLSHDNALLSSIILGLLVLLGIGIGKALLANQSIIRSAAEMVLIGSFAAGITYLIGTFIPVLAGHH